MNISLEGKSALVGGSSKGIGFGIAKQLAEHAIESGSTDNVSVLVIFLK